MGGLANIRPPGNRRLTVALDKPEEEAIFVLYLEKMYLCNVYLGKKKNSIYGFH